MLDETWFRGAGFVHPIQVHEGDLKMKAEIVDEILEELASTMQKLETQSAALLEFVKDKGIAKEDELAPFMERAAAASAVRWRATRVRMARLLASAENAGGQPTEGGKAADQKSKSKGDEHPQKQEQETMKQAESLATGPTQAQPNESQPEDDSVNQSEKKTDGAAQKNQTRGDDNKNEKAKTDSAPQRASSAEPAQKSTSAGDQMSATSTSAPNERQNVASDKDGGADQNKQNTDRQNVA